MAIADLAQKGRANYGRKLPGMASSYAASRERAIGGFQAVGFGPTRTRNYAEGWSVAPQNYAAKVRAGAEDKWARNWIAKMSE